MFDKISRAAERVAMGVSRRNFFGRVGRGAAVLAAGLGGILLSATDAHAGGGWCCVSGGASSGFDCSKGQCPKRAGTVGGPFVTVRCRDWEACRAYW
jgi:hypothetical protein